MEDLASLGGSAEDQRSVALLEGQCRADMVERGRMTMQSEHIAVALDRCLVGSRRERQEFERAVASRDVVGQAKGIIMVRWNLGPEAASAALREASGRSRRELQDVAAAVVEQQRRFGL